MALEKFEGGANEKAREKYAKVSDSMKKKYKQKVLDSRNKRKMENDIDNYKLQKQVKTRYTTPKSRYCFGFSDMPQSEWDRIFGGKHALSA